jgi:hypothetical protein
MKLDWEDVLLIAMCFGPMLGFLLGEILCWACGMGW